MIEIFYIYKDKNGFWTAQHKNSMMLRKHLDSVI